MMEKMKRARTETADLLTDKQRKFVELYSSGKMDKCHAAQAAGYAVGSGAKKAGSRLMKNPIVRQTIAKIRSKGAELAVYDLAKAMGEAEDVIAFAKLHKHPTAYFFAVRHRAHLAGLLVDKIQVDARIDLRSALDAARLRVSSLVPQPPVQLESTEHPVIGSAVWEPRIAGNVEDGQVRK